MILLTIRKNFIKILCVVNLLNLGCQNKSTEEIDGEDAGIITGLDGQVIVEEQEEPLVTLPWGNQLHPDPFFEYTNLLKVKNDFAFCEGNPVNIQHNTQENENGLQWQQGRSLLTHVFGSLNFEPLKFGHGGAYLIKEFNSAAQVINYTVFKITALNCSDVNMLRLPSSFCSEESASGYMEVDRSSVSNFDLTEVISAEGLYEGSPVRYMKDCRTDLPQFKNQHSISVLDLNPGVYSGFWKDKNGEIKVSSFKIIN